MAELKPQANALWQDKTDKRIVRIIHTFLYPDDAGYHVRAISIYGKRPMAFTTPIEDFITKYERIAK